MVRSLNNLYYIELGKLRERERINEAVKEIQEKYPHRDFSPAEVIDLVNGIDFNQKNQITNTYKGWE